MNFEQAVCGVASVLPPVGDRGGVSVLCYHEVRPGTGRGLDRFGVTAEAFEEHLGIARSIGRTVLPLADLSRAAGPSVLLTFDDNLPSHVSCALPILTAFGVSATFFLSPAELGTEGQLSRRDVDTLLAAGMFVGAHGNRHVTASTRPPAEFASDVRACAAFLQSLGMPLTWSYPGGYLGSFGEAHERILQAHGFDLRFTTMEGVCTPADYRRPQHRYVIRRDNSARYVKSAMTGGLQLVGLCKRLRGVQR